MEIRVLSGRARCGLQRNGGMPGCPARRLRCASHLQTLASLFSFSLDTAETSMLVNSRDTRWASELPGDGHLRDAVVIGS